MPTGVISNSDAVQIKENKTTRQVDAPRLSLDPLTPSTPPFPRISLRPLFLEKSLSTLIPMDKSLDDVRFIS